jgi:hypothetical protein
MSKKNKNFEPQNKLVVFQGKEVRRAWHNNEWYYSLVDVVAVLSDSKNPTDYLKKIRKRDEDLKSYLGTNCPQVAMQTSTGKKERYLQEIQKMSSVLFSPYRQKKQSRLNSGLHK